MFFLKARFFLCLPLTAAALAQTPNFGSLTALPAQKAPLAITSADFNGDGFLDLAISNTGVSTVSIFLGSAGGKFTAAGSVNLPSGCPAAYIAAGKFTGAASPDLVAVCALGSLVILPNAGGGNFGAPVSTVLSGPGWVGNLLLGSIHPAFADFNGDGHLDVAIQTFDLNSGTSGWWLLPGKGNGTFKAPTAIPFTGLIPLSLGVGDFNGDGKLDLVGSEVDITAGAQFEFVAGNGDGTFQAPTAVSLPPNVGSLTLPADVNGDGKLDVVFAGPSLFTNLLSIISNSGQSQSEVTVFLGDGKGGFKQAFDTSEPAYTSGATLASVLGTGKLDLVETVIQGDLLGGAVPTGQIAVRPGNGDGTFGNPIPLSVPSTTIPTDVTVGDFNGDGTLDIAVSSVPAAAVTGVQISLDLGSVLNQVLTALPVGNADVILNLAGKGPLINAGGIVIHAGAAAVVSPGSLVDIYGSAMATATATAPSGAAWPTKLGNVQVLVNTVPAPVYYVSPTQIIFQMPNETAPGTASVAVSLNGVTGGAASIAVQQAAPYILVYGTNRAIVVNPDGSVNGPGKGAHVGDELLAFLIGSGPLDNPIADGVAAPSSPLSREKLTTTATVGGTSASVPFAGMTPTFVGLMQVNFIVPNLPPGDYPLSIMVGATASNQPLITVSAPAQ